MAFGNFQHVDTSMFHQQTLLEWGWVNPNCSVVSALNNNHCLKLCSPEKSPEPNNQLLTALQFQSKARTGERIQGLRQIFALNQEILSLNLEDLSNPKYQLWWPHSDSGSRRESLSYFGHWEHHSCHWAIPSAPPNPSVRAGHSPKGEPCPQPGVWAFWLSRPLFVALAPKCWLWLSPEPFLSAPATNPLLHVLLVSIQSSRRTNAF